MFNDPSQMNALAPNPFGHGPFDPSAMPAIPGVDWNALSGMGRHDQMSALQSAMGPMQFHGFGGHGKGQMPHWLGNYMGQQPNTQFPLNPAAPVQGQQQPAQQQQQGFPMVGSQLGVIGAMQASSPFGLPRY